MYLTKEQEKILDGEKGEVVARMFRLLVRLGDIYKADKMIPVSSVQVSGVSYKSIGIPGMEFLEDIAKKNTKVNVLSTLNPAGMDLEQWKLLNFPDTFAENQLRIIESFRRMGIVISSTCTPYLVGNHPAPGEHIAWSESSAVSFSNSVLGARTNREGGPSALASAICGVTPNYGLHLTENRMPNMIVDVKANVETIADFGALGYYIGKISKGKIPYLMGIRNIDTDKLKSLGAAMAASGAVALYHIENITPEWRMADTKSVERIVIGDEEIKESYEKLNTGEPEEIDIAVFGCPHASINEIYTFAKLIEGKKTRKTVWICTSRFTKSIADNAGYTEIIEKAGCHIVSDTCAVVSPISEMGYHTTAVNSGKSANYLPGFCKQNVVFKNMKEIVDMIT